MKLRAAGLFLHRYAGLLMAIFLVVAGLTGSVIAYYHELDVLLHPELLLAAPHAADAEPLDPITLQEQLLEQVPGIVSNYVQLDTPPDQAVRFYVQGVNDPATGEMIPPEFEEYFVDPYSGKVLGGRTGGVLSFIYSLHYSLALGRTGSFLFGIIALLWTVDCFVGAYLTFPPSRGKPAAAANAPGWWARWLKSWAVRTGSLYKLTFTWHRASGLWVWALLFVFAWSAVAMNLRQVYLPVMGTLFTAEMPASSSLPRLDEPRNTPELSWREARSRARELMAAEAAARGFEIAHERRLRYSPRNGMFFYQVKSSLDVNTRYARTTVYFDGNTGEFAAFDAPTGQAAGNTITTWLLALHFADVWGRPYQLFVCVLGVLIAILSISGVYIWWKKWRSRRGTAARRRAGLEQSGDGPDSQQPEETDGTAIPAGLPPETAAPRELPVSTSG